jgi:hypothetical protein
VRCGLAVVATMLLGCQASTQPSRVPAAASRGSGPGSFDAPVMTCGPEDSYAYVASEFRCPDGSNPLGGDLGRAHDARIGAKRHPVSGDFVDIYRVACAGGPALVYVDMYGCDRMRADFRRATTSAPSPGMQEALRRFDAGDYPGAIGRCVAVMARYENPVEVYTCDALTTASMLVIGMTDPAYARAARTCGAMPPASEVSEVRAVFAVQILAYVARSGRVDVDGGNQVLQGLSAACQVSPNQIMKVINQEELHAERLGPKSRGLTSAAW